MKDKNKNYKSEGCVIFEKDKEIYGTRICSSDCICFMHSCRDKECRKRRINFTGGQTSGVVYSDIRDAKPNNSKKYKVIAKVKVGGNTYTGGWKNNRAYKEAKRHGYTNESSYYDCYLR